MPGADDYDAIMNMIHHSLNTSESWRRLQHRTDERCNGTVQLQPFEEDREITELVPQLQQITGENPPPPILSFFYFGLFDAWDMEAGRGDVGFYLAGGIGDPEEALLNGHLEYFPENGFLESSLLSSIYALQSEHPNYKDYIGYTLVLATAALLARTTLQRMGVGIPAYVGFDSGDCMLATSG